MRSDRQVRLSWTNPSDADFEGVKILRKTGGYPANPLDGTVVYNGSGVSCLDHALTNGVIYHYAAFSYDEAVNYSTGATVIAMPVESSQNQRIGNTTVFPNISTVANRRAMPFVMNEAGSLTSISIYHQGGTGRAILAVYGDASGRPGSRLAVTDSTTINSAEGWQTIALQNPVAVSAGQTIWLAWVFENDPGLRWTEGAPGRASSAATWSGGMPDSFGASTANTTESTASMPRTERMVSRSEQGRDQTGQKQIRVTVDERSLQTNYVSGFRPTMTDEEVMLDFGLNLIRPTGDTEHPVELVFQANNRLILSYYSAKRLAIALGQIVRQFEKQFGEIELNAGKRRIDQNAWT